MAESKMADINLRRFLIVISLVIFCTGSASAQYSDGLDAGGYLQFLPIRISAELPEPLGNEVFWEYRIQNRLNFSWYASSSVTFNAEMRTRFFAGDLVSDIPGYASSIDMDFGYADLSWLVIEEDDWIVHYMPDRLNVDWNTSDWRVTVGRQRINWGINTVSNPNDLFNIYSFYDFDYPERPGSDAIRVQHFLSWASRVELAVSPAREISETVAAALYAFNTRGYDVQLISGYFKNRLAVGGGWAGSIGQTGFKGEAMFFTDLGNTEQDLGTNIVAGLSADYMFDNSLYLVVEGLYNQAGGQENFILLGQRLSPDNPSFSKFQFTVQVQYPFTPIISGSLAAITYPDEEAFFAYPSISVSILQDLDFNLFTQIFAVGENSAFSGAGNVAAASLKWNF